MAGAASADDDARRNAARSAVLMGYRMRPFGRAHIFA
jgi:hypothetical protein